MEHPLSSATVAEAANAGIDAPEGVAELSSARREGSILLGFAFVALVDIGVFATRPRLRAPLSVRAVAELVSAGYLLAIGAIVAAGVAAWRRFGARSRLVADAVLVSLSWAITHVFCAEDLSGLADKLARWLPSPSLRIALLTLGVSFALPLALRLGALVRSWHWSLGVVLAALAVVLNGAELALPAHYLFFTQNYPGPHVLVAMVAGALAGLSFERAPVTWFAHAVPARVQVAMGGIAVAWGALAISVQPSNAVRFELQRHTGASLSSFLGVFHSSARGTPNVPAERAEWFGDRSALPPVPPNAHRLLHQPIVILLGIDSLRADVLRDEKYRDQIPTLFRLRDESVYFTNARSTGSSTGPSLSAMFSGLHYSQLYWTRLDPKIQDTSLVYPHDDPSPRFPAMLTNAGVDTLNTAGASWLLDSHGIVGGFAQEIEVTQGAYARAASMLNGIVARLEERGRQPQFYFAHLLDAHAPYGGVGKRSTPFLEYLAALGRVDKQLQRLLTALTANGLLGRTCVIVYADHGEAFGEHGSYYHAVNLYDELLRVPLMIHVPDVTASVVSDPVSTIDIGPTILDLMGVETPARFMGESLTGYLRGESPNLTRPIVAEARLKRAMVLPDGFKIIHDTRTHVVEVYDIASDPREENNVYREGDARSAERLGVLTAFFDAQTLRRPDYVVPYRTW